MSTKKNKKSFFNITPKERNIAGNYADLIQIRDGKLDFKKMETIYGSIKASKEEIILCKNLSISNKLTVNSSDNSTSPNSGSLLVHGGMGIKKDVNIGGNLNVSGLFNFNPNYDNFLAINTQPQPFDDAGFMIKRNKQDITLDNPYQTGKLKNNDVNYLILDNNALSINDHYNNNYIKFTSGANNNLCEKIIAYDGSTKTITLENDLINPSQINDMYEIYNEPYLGMMYDNLEKKIIFCTTSDITSNKSSAINLLDIKACNGEFTKKITASIGSFNKISATMMATSSDRRLKKNIKKVDDSKIFDIINKLNVVEYNWKNNILDDRPHIGFIAQDVEKIMPEIVQTDSNNYKSIAYDKLTPILLRAIKILQKKMNKII